jgi:anhydro-N-acetylmuramic acid kinase
VALKSVDLIGSHGQTIFHQGAPAPYLGRPIAATLQVAEPGVIAERTGVPVVADFRPNDVAAGGQGAPLVPYVDFLLYRNQTIGRVALNIGGIANLTAIPAGARPDQVLAFDTGPGNMPIDELTRHFTQGERQFDPSGKMARRGRVLPELLGELVKHRFFALPPPKSAGREQFGAAFVARILEWSRRNGARAEDVLRTTTELTAISIVRSIERWVFPRFRPKELIISGGGVHNRLLMQSIDQELKNVVVVRSEAMGVPEDAKEAMAFAILAYETFHGRPANLPSATGARHPAVLGKLTYGTR